MHVRIEPVQNPRAVCISRPLSRRTCQRYPRIKLEPQSETCAMLEAKAREGRPSSQTCTPDRGIRFRDGLDPNNRVTRDFLTAWELGRQPAIDVSAKGARFRFADNPLTMHIPVTRPCSPAFESASDVGHGRARPGIRPIMGWMSAERKPWPAAILAKRTRACMTASCLG